MKNIKKLLSLLLCGIMLFGMFPASLFAADGDTGDGSGTISETVVPNITWSRTFEYKYRHNDTEHQRTDLGGLHAGDKKNYFSTTSSTSNNTTTYKSTVTWDWAALSRHFNGQAEVDNSNHKVWDYGYTDVQYADPITDSIENPIDKDKTIGSIGIIPYAPSASEQAIFAATWNNRAAQEFKASSVDGTGIYYSGNYVSVKQGQMDIGYGKKASDSTISTFSGKSYTARRFSGSFVWPEGYTLSDSIELVSKNDSYYQEIYDVIEKNPDLKAVFGGKKVVAINDDMFVFVYKDGDQPTEDNYSDYLAFFAGTAGKGVWSWINSQPQNHNWGDEWNVTEPATYGDKYAAKAFNRILPNLDTAGADRSTSRLSAVLSGTDADGSTTATAGMMALSDYWYSFMDGNAISTVLNNKYGTTGIHTGDTVHIDIYCIDMDKAGGMDELEIRLTRQKPTTSSVTVRYWLNAVGETTDGNYLGSTIMTGQEIGSLITLANGTDVNQLNHKRAAAITKNNGGDVSDGSQQAPVPFTVKENSEENIIDVVYLPAGAKIVHFYAGNKTYAYTGQPFTVSDVTIKQGSYADIVVADSVSKTTQQLNEPNGWGQHAKGGNPFKVYIVDTYFCGDNSIGGNPPIPSIITGEGILDYQVPVVRAMNLDHANYSVRILGYLTDTAGAIVGPASPTPWDGGETGAEGSTRGANGIDTNRILREAGLKEFIGCEVETSFMDENSVLNGGTGIAAKNSPNRTFGKRGEETAQTADVYLDAFRVYKPLADETKYVENEQGLAYAPVYDYVKNSADLIPDEITDNSMVYVEYDGDTGIASIANYQKRGPQNEVYLTNGNYIGFALEGYTEGKTVMISAKAVAGEPILGYLNTNDVGGKAISSDMKMTEMYYDVTACVQQYGTKHMLVLGNIAEAGTRTGTRSILSVSGIKLANDITPATSRQIAADIASLVTLAYQPVEEPVFTPERFELRYSGRALAGWFTRISVKTSTDVDHVSVYRLADDGSLVPVRENMRPMNSLFTYFGWMDYYAFSLTVRAPRRGMTDTYYIFAYDANGVASEPAIASITGR